MLLPLQLSGAVEHPAPQSLAHVAADSPPSQTLSPQTTPGESPSSSPPPPHAPSTSTHTIPSTSPIRIGHPPCLVRSVSRHVTPWHLTPVTSAGHALFHAAHVSPRNRLSRRRRRRRPEPPRAAVDPAACAAIAGTESPQSLRCRCMEACGDVTPTRRQCFRGVPEGI